MSTIELLTESLRNKYKDKLILDKGRIFKVLDVYFSKAGVTFNVLNPESNKPYPDNSFYIVMEDFFSPLPELA